jgi:hypothetical protein
MENGHGHGESVSPPLPSLVTVVGKRRALMRGRGKLRVRVRGTFREAACRHFSQSAHDGDWTLKRSPQYGQV